MKPDLDDLLLLARPSSLGDDPELAAAARRLAQAVAHSANSPARTRAHRVRLLGGLSLVIALGSATAAAAMPAIVSWAPWEPDLVVSRTFAITGGGTMECVMIMSVDRDYATADDHAEGNVAEARAFLRDHDWSNFVASAERDAAADGALSAAGAAAAAADTADGASAAPDRPFVPPFSQSLTAHVVAEFSKKGLMRPGVSLEAGVRCEPRA